MKIFTIITPPECEALLLEALSSTGVCQLKEVTGADFEKLKKIGERSVDFKSLYKKFHETYQSLVETAHLEPDMKDLSIDELREFTDDPEGTVDSFLTVLNGFTNRLEEAKARQEAMRKERKARLLEARARLEKVRALHPEEFKRCLAVGLVEHQHLQRLVEHLQRFEDVSYKVVDISPETGYIFVFGPEKRMDWVETIFPIFEVKDIFEVLPPGDVLLALDTEIREKAIKEYEEEIEKLQLLAEREEEIDVIKEQIGKIQVLVSARASVLCKAKFLDHILGILSNETAPVLRTRVISVIQGWIPEDKLQVLDQSIEDLEVKTGEPLFVQYEDPSHEEEVPTRRPTVRPKFFNPAFTLTSLRGWPNAHELNPTMVTLFMFSLQFGVMFGDMGQGLILLILGLILSKKFKRGLASKIGVAFIPMGIMCIVFGFLYGEIFLIEGIIPPLLLSPIHSIGPLFKMVLGIAVAEMSVGLALGAINEYKKGNIAGVIGEHGAGGILFFVGLYFMALQFVTARDFAAVMNHWSFIMLMIGLVMTFIEPMLSAVVMHKEVGFEVVGEGMAGFLITFIEGLCNFFSFLRLAAFALAHGCLAIAAHSLMGVMGAGGIVLMNVIAMTFEFVSSSVQSLRLLYYEFMGKFFHGTGTQFRPFRLRRKVKL